MTRRMTPAQIRGARGMLDWSMTDLAKAAGVSVSTVKRMETAEPQSPSDDVCSAVWDALSRAGIRFLDSDGEGEGVRLADAAEPSHAMPFGASSP